MLILPPVLILSTETVARVSLSQALGWSVQRETLEPLRFTYLWLLCLMMLAWGLANRLRIAIGVCVGLTTMLAVVHAGKMAILQQPLLPSDFALAGAVVRVWSAAYFPFGFSEVAFLVLLAIVWTVVCRYGLPDVRLQRPWRVGLCLATGASLMLLSAQVRLLASRVVAPNRKLTVVWRPESNAMPRDQVKHGIQNPDFSAALNSQSFGLICGLLMGWDASRSVAAPPGYGREAVHAAWQRAPAAPSNSDVCPAGEPPHVVVVLSESFWDPCLLEDAEISPDPLPNFRAAAAGPTGCRLTTVSPVFGGYTCNAEFELLTGIAIGILPPDVRPYAQRFNSRVPSLPSAFRQAGYQTVAIHPFLPEFWNRNLIYPAIGFQQFIHIGTMRHREAEGKFISDSALADEILDSIEAAEGPAFVFAVSMQNHSPYGDGRYGLVEQDTVRLKPGSRLDLDSVRDYVHGVRRADAMLGKLTSRLQACRRPVLLLFVGDHQPNLEPTGAPAGIYSQGGRSAGGNAGLRLRGRFLAPGLAWSNRLALRPPSAGPVSLAALPGWLLQQAGGVTPPFYHLTAPIFADYPVIHPNWALTAAGESRRLPLSPPDPRLLDYEIIAYDLVLGRNYSQLPLP